MLRPGGPSNATLVSLLSLLLLTFSPLPGAGQDLDGRLRSRRDDLMDNGFTEIGNGENGALEQAQETRFPLSIQEAVEYRFVGVCDNDCENLDLALFDSSEFDTFLILETPGGHREQNDDYGDDTMHSHIEWVAEEGVDYSILVSSFSDGVTGEYVLQVAVMEGS